MPHIVLKIASGRSDQQKANIADALSAVLVSVADIPENAVSVSIEDVDPKEWADKVYYPDIVGKSELLVKKPGYTLE